MLIVKKKKDAFASTLKTFLKEITCGGRKMQSFLGEQNSTEFFGQRKPNFSSHLIFFFHEHVPLGAQ